MAKVFKTSTRMFLAVVLLIVFVGISMKVTSKTHALDVGKNTSSHFALPAHTGSTGPSVAGPSQAVSCSNPHYGYPNGPGLMVAYIGSDLHIHIHDFVYGTDDRDPTQTTPIAPTISCYGVLLVSWKANDSSNRIYNGFYECPNPEMAPPCYIAEVSAFSDSTYASPALSNSCGILAWSGTDSSHHLYYKYATSVSQGLWSQTYMLTDYTWQDGGVSVTCDASGRVWFTWVASSGTPYIYLGSLPSLGSTKLNGVSRSPDYTEFAPGLGAKNTIYFIFSQYNGLQIFTTQWSNGWARSVQQSDTTSYPPTIECEGTDKFTTFLGTNSIVYYDHNAYGGGCS